MKTKALASIGCCFFKLVITEWESLISKSHLIVRTLKMKFFLALTIFVTIFSSSVWIVMVFLYNNHIAFILTEWSVAQNCNGPHELYTDCGTACPPTCENRNTLFYCTLQCVSGCFCKPGFVRNNDGVCVNPNSCPNDKICRQPNQEWSDCGANGCQNTCKSPTLQTYCTAMCMAGCVCKQGYVRNGRNGSCVLEADCPRKK